MTAAGELAPGFLPAAFFPGRARAEANRAAWEAFWGPERVAALKTALQTAGSAAGFSEGAFDPFLKGLENPEATQVLPDQGYFELLGIVPEEDGSGWRQFFTLIPDRGYRAAAVDDRLERTGTARLFDPGFFAERLGGYLAETFRQMLLLVGASAVLLLGLFFWDLTLTALALLPLAGAFVGTLGIMGLAGRPLDIPALMLAIIVLGMGIDYALFTIRAFQRYGRETAPELALFRTTVFLAAASTLVGFGALTSAEHAVFQSAGVTSFGGILLSAAGAFILLPPLLRRLFRPAAARPEGASIPPSRAARRRFRHLELAPRLAARRILRKGGLWDTFPLPAGVTGPAALYPVGYGAEAAWLLETIPGLRLVGADPDEEKVRIAARVAGVAGRMRTGGIGALETGADAAPAGMMILTGWQPEDGSAADLLRKATDGLAPGGRLWVVARTAEETLRPRGWQRWAWPGPRPFNVMETEALLRRLGYATIERSTTPGGASPLWLSALKGKGPSQK
jgi:hypothetical protein